MRMNDILNEAIVENGTGLVAYCIVVAEEYAKLPMVDKSKVPLWFELVAHNSKMADKILSKLDVEFTEEDPYKTQKEMLYDIVINKKLKIFKSKDASLVISDEENNIGRVVHDYLGHYLPNHKAFVELVSKNAVTSKAYSEFRFKSHSFTVRGELSTYLTHSKLLSNKLHPVLFSEICAQICTYFVTNDYTVNKVATLDGVDFKNIGLFTSAELSARKEKYLGLLNDDSVEEFETQIGMFKKSDIRWNVLSRGEGQTKKGYKPL